MMEFGVESRWMEDARILVFDVIYYSVGMKGGFNIEFKFWLAPKFDDRKYRKF